MLLQDMLMHSSMDVDPWQTAGAVLHCSTTWRLLTELIQSEEGADLVLQCSTTHPSAVAHGMASIDLPPPETAAAVVAASLLLEAYILHADSSSHAKCCRPLDHAVAHCLLCLQQLATYHAGKSAGMSVVKHAIVF